MYGPLLRTFALLAGLRPGGHVASVSKSVSVFLLVRASAFCVSVIGSVHVSLFVFASVLPVYLFLSTHL